MDCIDSEIGRTMAYLGHAKTDDEKKKLHQRLSDLAKKKQLFLKHEGSYRNFCENEDLHREEALIEI